MEGNERMCWFGLMLVVGLQIVLLVMQQVHQSLRENSKKAVELGLEAEPLLQMRVEV